MQHKAKKSLGQNFLKSKKTLLAMCKAGELFKTDTVLEIGPGKGALTEYLLKSVNKIIAIEKDYHLCEVLSKKFQKEITSGHLVLVKGDILEFNPGVYLTPAPLLGKERGKIEYKIIANIPYNITGAIFRKFLSENIQPQTMVLLVQKEVAERIVARDGKESILSISVKAYGTPKYITKVSKKFFSPAPKVDSAIIQITNISKENFVSPLSLTRRGLGRGSEDFPLSSTLERGRGEANLKNLPSIPSLVRRGGTTKEDWFFKLVRAGFAHKRKVLISNLSAIVDKKKIKEFFQIYKINEKVRAEDLKIGDWLIIAKGLNPQ